jgi:hypothetical protein
VAKAITFGDFQYRSRKDAIDEARRRISQYDQGEKLRVEDEFFFASLFTLHPEYWEKKGPGIDYVTVERDFRNNRYLRIHRVDDSTVDISWRTCVSSPSRKKIVSDACRRTAKALVKDFKSAQVSAGAKCPILGVPLSFGNSRVSYTSPTFNELLSDFLASNGIGYEDVELDDPDVGDDDMRGVLRDGRLAEKWISYVREHASFQLISSKANLRKLKE